MNGDTVKEPVEQCRGDCVGWWVGWRDFGLVKVEDFTKISPKAKKKNERTVISLVGCHISSTHKSDFIQDVAFGTGSRCFC